MLATDVCRTADGPENAQHSRVRDWKGLFRRTVAGRTAGRPLLEQGQHGRKPIKILRLVRLAVVDFVPPIPVVAAPTIKLLSRGLRLAAESRRQIDVGQERLSRNG